MTFGWRWLGFEPSKVIGLTFTPVKKNVDQIQKQHYQK